MSARAASLQAGLSSDAIRNWDRRLASGKPNPGISIASLEAVAKAIKVDLKWLLGDVSLGTPATPIMGLAEDAQPYNAPALTESDPIRTLFANRGRNAAITHRAAIDLPAFGIGAGDLIVCDLSRLPEPGEVAIAVSMNTDTGTSHTIVRRYAPPFLLGADTLKTPVVELANSGLDVRHPIIGVIRGT